MRQFLKHYLPNDTRAKLLRVERFVKLMARPQVIRDLYMFSTLRKAVSDNRFTTKIADIFPVTGENTSYTSFDRHYVYHTSWAARVVREILDQLPIEQPFKHIDISSSLYFSGIVSAFVPVEFYDYRPASLILSDLNMNKGDLMKLPFEDKSVVSISCLHTIEHVGLGRYGDPLDPQGDIKAINELKRVVASKGNLILVMPVGRQRIAYNAHRIYKPEYIRNLVCGFSDDKSGGVASDTNSSEFTLKEYAYIPETDKEGPIIRNANINHGQDVAYGCGCFWFVRK